MKLKLITVAVVAAGLSMLGAGAAQASAPASYVTAVWLMPDNGDFGPQKLVSSAKHDTITLDAPVPTTCGAKYQIDVYLDDDTTTALLAGGHLDSPNHPAEHLAPGGEGKAWKVVTNKACPDKPEPSSSQTSKTEKDCDSKTATTITTTVSVDWKLDKDAGVWNKVETTTDDKPGVTRDLTAEELAACPTHTTPPTSHPTPPPTAHKRAELAHTGGNNDHLNMVGGALTAGLLFMGAGAWLLGRRRA